MDGRMNLFWPEWRAPVLGDVDFSGSELSVDLAPGLRARGNLRRREGEVKAFQVDPDEYYLEAYNQFLAQNGYG